MNRRTTLKGVILVTLYIVGGLTFSTLFGQESGSLKTEDILNMSIIDLMNVQVISASKTQQSIKEVSASVHVITSEQIKDRSYFTLEEALSDLPGFQFRNILGFNSYVFMRGAPSQNNLILLMVDGVQINELNSGGFYAGGQFDLSDVDQIEVVYGPASALYGTNAVSGIINIITKKPANNSGHLSLLGGNFKTGMVNFNLSKYNPDKETGFSVSGQYKTSEKADLAGAAGDNNWTNDMENFENDASLTAKFRVKDFSSGVFYQEKKSSMSTNFKTVDDISLDKNTIWDIMFLNAYLKYSNTHHDKWSLNSTGYFRNATVRPNTIDQIIKPTSTTEGDQIGYYRPNHLFGIENQFNYTPNQKLLLFAGIIGEAEVLSDGFSITHSNSVGIAPPVPLKPPMLNNYLLSYYSQIHYHMFEDLSFTAGIRHDFSSYYGQVFIPRIGLVFNHNKFNAKALYNTAFRSPKPWDYRYGTGNDDLQPEKMKSLEGNIAYQFSNNLTAGASVFYNIIDDKLTKETTSTIDRWINKDILNTTGFELFGNFTSGKLDLYVNYSFNDSRDQEDAFISEISRHIANAGVTYLILKTVKINLRSNYLGDRKNPFIIPATGNDRIEDALIFHGCVSFTGIKGCNLQLKVNNIFNEKYYHPSNRFNGRYRQPQSTFLFCATYNFNLK